MVNWKIPGWAAAGGAVVSLAAGLAGGNPFGVVLLRAVLSALVTGALGFAAGHLLRRFLPDLGSAAARPPQPGVDILVDEEIPLGAGEGALEEVPLDEASLAEAPVGQGPLSPGPLGEASLGLAPGNEAGEAVDELGLEEGLSDGLGELGPAEEEPFAAPAGAPLPGFSSGGRPFAAAAGAAQPSGPAAEEAPEAEELEALSAAEQDDGLSGRIAEPSPRSQKAEELEAQLDSVTRGQDPESLAKAVRTFLRKDQEG